MKISTPGFLDALPSAEYHGDICIGPSLSHSGVHPLVDECPAIFWQDSYFNPNREQEQRTTFDIGTAAHLITLEPEQRAGRVVLINTKDYRTDAAQVARNNAYASNLTPLLPQQVATIDAMHDALMSDPVAATAFTAGVPERSYFAKDPFTGVWLKCRPDYDREETLIDFKTTTDASPQAFARRGGDLGYWSQAVWYSDVVELAVGRQIKEFWFVCQSTKPPYLVSVNKYGINDLYWGRLVNRHAINLFAKCLAAGKWPGYRDPRTPDTDGAHIVEIPSYVKFRLQMRDQLGEFDEAKKQLMVTGEPE